MPAMEREDPRLTAPDASGFKFRHREVRNSPTPRAGSALWLQIALGVFVGMLGHSLLTGMYVRWESEQALKALNKQMATETARLNRAAAAIIAPPLPPRATVAPLRDDERCIKGDRFRRVDNGWVHLPRNPC